ncbi:hypothetical protein ACFQ2Y_28090 [Streptomyces malaysiensis subsp. malaysiensis]
MLRQMERPGGDAAVLEVVLVEVDLRSVQLLLLLGPQDLQLVLLVLPPQLQLMLRVQDFARVADLAQLLAVGDRRFVRPEPHHTGGVQADVRREGAAVDGALYRLFGPGAVLDGEAAADRAGEVLELPVQPGRHIAFAAGHEARGIGDPPGELGGDPEGERVVVTGEFEVERDRVSAHVHLVHGGVAAARGVGAARPLRWQIGVVRAPGRHEDERVIDRDHRPAGHVFEPGHRTDGQHRVDQIGVAVGLLLPFGLTAEVRHEVNSSGGSGRVNGTGGRTAAGPRPRAAARRVRRAGCAADG